MTDKNTRWKVLPHGPLEPLAENLWRVWGSVPGMSLKRNMLVVRRPDGTLLIHNAIALADAQQAELEALGKPTVLIVPSAIHRLDAPAYLERYPELRVYAPSGARSKVAEVVPVNGTYEDFPEADDVRLEALLGVAGQEGAMLVRSADGVTVVLNDVVMNMDRKRDFVGFVFTTLLGSAPGPRVSRLSRWQIVKDQPALREELLRFAELPDLVRLSVAHEKVAHGPDAATALRKAATYLRSA